MTEDRLLLLDYARHGSQSAFTELMGRHLSLVYGAAQRRLPGQPEQAKDVVQQVFVTLAKHAGRLQSHPCLEAWLHTTTKHAVLDLQKQTRRRQWREAEAAREAEPFMESDALTPQDLDRLRRLLDAALDHLSETDRQILLLRHFKALEFKEIAERLKCTPDSARMRATRALERLRNSLAKDGIRSSAAALATALAAEASVSVPATLSTEVLAAMASGSSALPLPFVTQLSMGAGKAVSLSAGFGGLALLLAGLVWHTESEIDAAQAKRDALRRATISQMATSQSDQAKLLEVQAKSAAIRDDLNALRNAQLEAEEASASEISEQTTWKRYQEAKRLKKAGQWKDALTEYLWCLELGMKGKAAYAGVRNSYVIEAILDISKQLPEARQALIEQRNRLAKQASDGDGEDLQTLVCINDQLEEPKANLSLLDSLPKDSPLRESLYLFAYEDLVEAGRYADALLGREISEMTFYYENELEEIAKRPQEAAQLKEHLSEATSRDLCVLAATGNLNDAKGLAERLLKDLPSPETRTRVQEAFTKAGHPELAKFYRDQP